MPTPAFQFSDLVELTTAINRLSRTVDAAKQSLRKDLLTIAATMIEVDDRYHGKDCGTIHGVLEYCAGQAEIELQSQDILQKVAEKLDK